MSHDTHLRDRRDCCGQPSCCCTCPPEDARPNWLGLLGGSEHRTTGLRAWCFTDAEWCSERALCFCCDQTRVPERWRGMNVGEVLEELRAGTEGLPMHEFQERTTVSGDWDWRLREGLCRDDVLALIRGEGTDGANG